MNNPFQLFYEQHADEVSHLWLLWQQAGTQPNHTRATLSELETRLFTHIAGLMTEPDLSWQLCEANLQFEQPAELFAAAQIAFRTYNAERIKTVVDCAQQNPHMAEGLVSALNWLPGDICHPWLKKLLASKALGHKALALAVCRARNEDPGQYLTNMAGREDCLAFEPLLDEIFLCIGVFKREALQPLCRTESYRTRFSAQAALTLLGEPEAAEALRPFVFDGGEDARAAIDLAFAALPVATARGWISELAQSSDDKRPVIQATGTLGDPHALPWLSKQMNEPKLARLAGEAFSQITGIDIEHSVLSGTPLITPEQQWEDDALQVPEDEYLPWPDAAAIARYCQGTEAASLQSGTRYFLGQPINDAQLKHAFAHGQQRHRRQAALMLALRHPRQPLLNVCGRQTPQS